MATLNTPSIYSISAFDPAHEHIFEFYYTGNQIYSNRAIITDNTTQGIVYDETQDGLKASHTLPANTLESGKSYTIQIQVFDINGDSSEISTAMLFYCFTTSEFYFGNVKNGDLISGANYELELMYSQIDGEALNEYQYYVYDATRSPIYSSKSYYTSENLKHTIYGLQNNSIYYVRAIGNTTHGMQLDTDFIQISIKYNTVEPNISFIARNDATTGCIILSSNILTVPYEIKSNDYIIENGMVNLEDNMLTYELKVNGDFCIVLKAKKIPIDKFLFTDDGSISFSVVCIADTYYCNLKIQTTSECYNIFKELPNGVFEDGYVSVDESIHSVTSLFVFEIFRANNIYDFTISYT